jgi:hypothetical protein
MRYSADMSIRPAPAGLTEPAPSARRRLCEGEQWPALHACTAHAPGSARRAGLRLLATSSEL